MITAETNQAPVVAPEGETTNEAPAQDAPETVSVSKTEYDKLQQDLGSAKRELKDLKKPKDTPATDTSAPDANTNLLQKTFLRAATITAEDEVDLALETAKKWGLTVDKLVDDTDWKDKLQKFRDKKSNEAATSNVRGNGSTKAANHTAEHWIAKGTPPTPDQVPDRKVRAGIIRAMMAAAKNNGKTFYND